MIPDPIRAQSDARPGAPAVATGTAVWSWADLDARVAACAHRLAGDRLAGDRLAGDRLAGDRLGGESRVGVVAVPSADVVVLLFAALRAGVVVVPLAPRWPAADVDAAASRLGLSTILDEATLADLTSPSPGSPVPSPQFLTPSQPWTVVHTSGSSGAPKAVLHTVENHVESARGVNARVGLRAGDTWLLDLPLHHVGGLGVVVRCAVAGATMAIPAPGTGTAEALRRFRPTHASLVSTQLYRLLRDDAAAGSSLRAILLGGSGIAPTLLDASVSAGLPVCVGYGMTETTSTVTMTAPGAGRDALGTSGTPLPGREVRVSEAGEIEVRGTMLAAGTIGPGGLVPLPATDGWFATGDVGRIDAAGRLVVTGRAGTRFVSGGENVQPEAVEAALAALPGVAEAVVVPVPDAEWGARPVAFVRMETGEVPDAEAIRSALRRVLPPWAVPAAVLAWSGAAGLKPDRVGLAVDAERLWTGLGAL